MASVRLVRPSVQYKKSFLAGLREFDREGTQDRSYGLRDMLADFPRFVQILRGREKGIGLPKGFVPYSAFWLIDRSTLIGQVSVRRRLTPYLRKIGGHIGYVIRPSKRRRGYGTAILRLALLKAKKLGLKKVLVTCDTTNIGSRKIIEKNGGVLENAVAQGRRQPKKLRFWIHI